MMQKIAEAPEGGHVAKEVPGAPVQSVPKRRWRRWLILGAVLAILAVVVTQVIAILPPMGGPAPQITQTEVSPVATPAPPDAVRGLGTLTPRGDVRTVALPSGANDAVVADLLVEVGDSVERGQIIATLDRAARLEAVVAQAEADVRLREAELATSRATVQFELEDARAAIEIARAALENARRAAVRSDRLFQDNTVSQAQRDAAELDRLRAEANVDRAQSRLTRYDGDPETQPDVAAAGAAVDAARAALATAREDLDMAVVHAPIDGVVLEVLTRAGERPGTEGIVRVGNTAQMQARVEMFQSRIALVGLGDPVTLTSDALDRPLTGTVSRIGIEVRRQGEIGDDPAANTNARVVEIVVDLVEDSSERAATLTNLQVLATIDVGDNP